MMKSFCKKIKFIIDIWQSPNAFELADKVWWCLTRIFECCECFRKFMAKLITFFEKGQGMQPTITCPTIYTFVRRQLREKDSMKDRNSLLNVVCRKEILQSLAIHRKILRWSLFLKLQVLSMELSKKLTLVQIFSYEFFKIFKIFFKYTSWQPILEEHWISLKML